MMTVAEWKRALNAGKLDEKLKQLYGSDAAVMGAPEKTLYRGTGGICKAVSRTETGQHFLGAGTHRGGRQPTQITSTAVSLRRQSIWM